MRTDEIEVVATEGAEAEDEVELKTKVKLKIKMSLTPGVKDMNPTHPGTVAKLIGNLLKTLGNANHQ